MRRFLCSALVACLLVLLAPVVLAAAKDDLRIRSERDRERNTIYNVINNGTRTVRTKIKLKKTCSGTANARRDIVKTYWVGPGETVQLGKSWPGSTCRRDYRVVEAEYM